MAEASVSAVVERLGDLLIREAGFLRGVSDTVAEIQAELRRMKCFLKDADARQNEDTVLRTWVAEVREAAYDVEDVVETFAVKIEQRIGKTRRYHFQKLLSPRFFEIKTLHGVGAEIEATKNRIASLNARLQYFNLRSIADGERSGSRYESQRQLRRAYSHAIDEDTVGVEDNVNFLVEQLVNPDKRCSVVSICGMGGLGKTTLAKEVYHHVAVRRHFDCFAWTHLSQQFNIRAVVQEILINFMPPSPEQRKEIEKMSDHEVLKRVYQIQEKKKCLVILEDVWSTDDWDTVRPAFPLPKAGSKILLTTRRIEVASYADPQGLYQLKFLNKEQSWKILERRAFLRNDNGTDPSMKELGREMVTYCLGLPLALVVLGGLLSKKHTSYEWGESLRNITTSSFLRKDKSTCEDQLLHETVFDVLTLSYQDLPYQLKSCFLYLGHFPPDYAIPTKTLVQMWVAEGIIPRMGEETLEDVAEGYLIELIERCMVQVRSTSSNGRVKTCQLHDLMRDLCLLKAKEENFLEIINLQQVETSSSSSVITHTLNKVRRRAIHLDQSIPMDSVAKARVESKNKDEGAKSYVNLNLENGTHLRSLLIFYPPADYTAHGILRKLDLRKFQLLRVLSLEGLSLEEKLLHAIGSLIHLNYLSFKDAQLLCFPSSIGNLGCIQMLDLRFHFRNDLPVTGIPDVIGRMKWLRHLYLPTNVDIDSSEVQWNKLTNLQTLKGFDAVRYVIKDLAQSTQLRKLMIKKVKSFTELVVILKPSCPISNNLHSLVLNDVSTTMEEADIRQLSTCQHLYKLFLGGEIRNLPGHHHFPPNLTKLTLSKARLKQDSIAILERLLNLTSLYLWVDSYVGEEIVFSTNGFPRLKILCISEIDSLKRLRVDKGAIPSLWHLRISKCTSLEMVPEGLTSLQVLEIKFMPREFTERLQVINEKEGEDFYKVQHVPSISFTGEIICT